MTTNGALTTLVSLDINNGASPRGRLIQGTDGDFYGTTYFVGTGINRDGTVFKMTTNGLLTTLFSFDGFTDDGHPTHGLVEGKDGDFYGTTPSGAPYGFGLGYGIIFKMDTNGAFTTLFIFRGTNCEQPQAELMQGIDGNFYGTTYGGNFSSGSVFKMTASGVLTKLITFNGTNGANPDGKLIQASDGNLYSTTYFGGANNNGIVFRIVMPVVLNSRRIGNELVLSWPTNQVGFTLQSALDLDSSANWIDSSNSPVVLGKEFVVTNSISGSAQFYRLKK